MEFIIYLLKVNIAVLVFYCIYRIFFQKDTLFQWKRIVFIGIIFTSLLFPLVKISGLSLPNKVVTEKIGYWVYSLPEITVLAQSQIEQKNLSFIHVIQAVYIIGVILLLMRFFIQVISLTRMVGQSEKSSYKEQTIYIKKGIQTPFSFFNWIVLNPEQHQEDELEEILSHETTHIRQFHSLDAILSKLFTIFCWFNPIAWLLKREIRMNLEYLADRSVIASGFDSKQYQSHLLRLSHHKAAAKLSNNFNVSPLKSRIIMINKRKTSLWNTAKYAVFAPLALLLISINSYSLNGMEENVASSNLSSSINIQEQTDEEPVHIHSIVDTPPQFSGGNEAMMKWFANNLEYPAVAQKDKIEGVVTVRFVVGPDGSIGDAEVIKSVNPILDKEAVRVIKTMPKWTPGYQKGKEVHAYYRLPIIFSLRLPEKREEKKAE
jgi:TonB family C-terminal domain